MLERGGGEGGGGGGRGGGVGRWKDTMVAVTVLASLGPTPWAQLVQQQVSL